MGRLCLHMAAMTIEKLDNSRLLISLCKYDMERLNLREDNMTLKNQEFKDTIKAILSVAMYEAETSINGRKAYIEALPYEDGCFLLVTLVYKEKRSKRYKVKRKKKALYHFDDFEDIINMSYSLTSQGISCGNTRIFESEGKYYLYCEDCSNCFERIVREYAQRISLTNTEIARFNEYGNVIASGNAIKKIADSFL